jgi:hypothetical protein
MVVLDSASITCIRTAHSHRGDASMLDRCQHRNADGSCCSIHPARRRHQAPALAPTSRVADGPCYSPASKLGDCSKRFCIL